MNRERQMVLRLWKAKFDTLQIEHMTKVPETTVLKWISEQRSAELGLPSPYENRPARMIA